jgi:hypothetical protein
VGDSPDGADVVEAWAFAFGPELIEKGAADAFGRAKLVNCIRGFGRHGFAPVDKERTI